MTPGAEKRNSKDALVVAIVSGGKCLSGHPWVRHFGNINYSRNDVLKTNLRPSWITPPVVRTCDAKISSKYAVF
jgi:hypothetical protein